MLGDANVDADSEADGYANANTDAGANAALEGDCGSTAAVDAATEVGAAFELLLPSLPSSCCPAADVRAWAESQTSKRRERSPSCSFAKGGPAAAR